MLEEAMKFLFSKGQESLDTTVTRLDGQDTFSIVNTNTGHFYIPDTIKHNAKFNTLEGFLDGMAKLDGSLIEASPVCYVGRDRIRLVGKQYSDGHFEGAESKFQLLAQQLIAELRLTATAEFTALSTLVGSGRSFDLKHAVKFLRRELDIDDPTLLGKLRKIDFSRRSDGSQRASRGSESFGKSVEAVVNNIDELPEHFLTTFHPFAEVNFFVSIYINFDVEIEEQKINLWVSEDKLDQAVEATVEQAFKFVSEVASKMEHSKVLVLQATDE